MKPSVAISQATDALNQEIIDKKMLIPSLPNERAKIEAMKALFPIHYRTLVQVGEGEKRLVIFKWAFFDWADFVCRHIKNEDIAIKDPEIDYFRDTLTKLFELVGNQRAKAFEFAKSKEAQDYIENNFGYLNLIKEVEALNDPQYRNYLNFLTEQGPVYPKLEDLIDESYNLSGN